MSTNSNEIRLLKNIQLWLKTQPLTQDTLFWESEIKQILNPSKIQSKAQQLLKEFFLHRKRKNHPLRSATTGGQEMQNLLAEERKLQRLVVTKKM